MRLDARIRRVESRLGLIGPCSLCQGRGWYYLVHRRSDEPPRPPPGCPVCGAVPEHYKVHIWDREIPRMVKGWKP